MRNLASWDLPVLFWKDVVHFFREPGVRASCIFVPLLSAPIVTLLVLESLLLTRSGIIETPTRVCLVQGKPRPQLMQFINQLSKLHSVVFIDPQDPKDALKKGDIDAILTVSPDNKDIDVNAKNGWVQQSLRTKITETIEKIRRNTLNAKKVPERLHGYFTVREKDLNIRPPISEEDVCTLLLIVFCNFCVGGVVTCILIGEFEHRTIETTLIQPSRHAALAAKALAAVAITMVPVLMGAISFGVPAAIFGPFIPAMMAHFKLTSVIVVAVTGATVCLYTACIDMYFSILMRGAKIATIFMNLGNNLVTGLAAVGIMPFVTFNRFTACIPVLNVCLASKSLLIGQTRYLLCAFSFSEMFVICFVLLRMTAPLFSLEEIATNILIKLYKLTNFRNTKTKP